MISTEPLPQPPEPEVPTIDVVQAGPPIPAIKRIQLFSPDEWEDFVLEWAHSLTARYARVNKCGGAGDQGRDVIGFDDSTSPPTWDNYQCKHYKQPLQPSDIWTELGKLTYYTHTGEYSAPRHYFFVAPHGLGTTLTRRIGDSNWFSTNLIQNWDTYCTRKIKPSQSIPLTDELREFVESFDFSIIDQVPPLDLLTGHASTRWHAARFGGQMKDRGEIPSPPAQPAPAEAVYLRKLFDAYAEHRGKPVAKIEDLRACEDLSGHCHDSRREFYSAESLRSFSRDTLPVGSFEVLQQEIHDGIRDELRHPSYNGYQRVLAVVKSARQLAITSHPLLPRMNVRDRGGVCHQLANDHDDIRWVKP